MSDKATLNLNHAPLEYFWVAERIAERIAARQIEVRRGKCHEKGCLVHGCVSFLKRPEKAFYCFPLNFNLKREL